MILMYRALNEFDIACNPLMNGLASKKLIYDLTLSYLESNERKFFSGLTEMEKDEYCKKNMIKYIKTHQYKFKKMIDKRGKKITTKLSNIKYCDSESWAYLMCCLSTLNSHLLSGSKLYTDWISSTKSLNGIAKYYKEQSIHKVAILASTSNGLFDNNTIVIDLSSKKIIKEILPLISKKISDEEIKKIIEYSKQESIFFDDIISNDIFKQTNEKFMGFNYSISDNEVCIYRYFPSTNVICVLESLQLDLIELKLFNPEFINLDKGEQIKQLEILKHKLKQKIIKLHDPYMLHIFEELYIDNKNIKDIKQNIFENKKINHNRLKILRLATQIPNIQIKR